MEENLSNLLDLPGVTVESWHYSDSSVSFNLSILISGIHCPYCRKYTTELDQVRPILVRDLPTFGKQVHLNLTRCQFYCRFCQRYVTEQLEFINWRRKYTKRYKEMIYYLVHNSSIEKVTKQEDLSIEQVNNIVNLFNHEEKTKMAFS
jgi:transposase